MTKPLVHPGSLVALPWVIILLSGCAGTREPVRAVPAGWGVDTTEVAGDWTGQRDPGARAAIYRLWARYLESRAGPELNPHASEFWSPGEQARWPDFDLTWFLAYERLFEGVQPTVLEIRPSAPGEDDEYLIRTLFSAVLEGDGGREVKPLALTRVYAVRRNGRWLLAGALPRLTRGWERRRVGWITYVHPPAHSFDASRARSAVRFADSVAAAFGAPAPDDLTYYVTASSEEAYRIMGFDWVVRGSLTGGRAFPHNGLVITGDPGQGESYRHELVHMVLEPLAPVGATHPLVHEGVATWLGGALGMSAEETRRRYGAFLRSHPATTLETLLAGTAPGRQTAAAGAILFELVHARVGMEGVGALLDIGRSDRALRRRVSRILGLPWERVCDAWRRVAVADEPRAAISSETQPREDRK